MPSEPTDKHPAIAGFLTRLRAARAAAGKTGQDVAEHLVSQGLLSSKGGKGTLSAWETGKTQPNLQTLAVLCELYGVDISYVLTGRDRWPFSPALLTRIQALDGTARTKLEGAIEMWLQQNDPGSVLEHAA